jgi:hypothetical protein
MRAGTSHRKVEDLVRARGELGRTSDKNGEGDTVCTTDRNVDRFDYLRAAKADPQKPAPSHDDISEIPY